MAWGNDEDKNRHDQDNSDWADHHAQVERDRKTERQEQSFNDVMFDRDQDYGGNSSSDTGYGSDSGDSGCGGNSGSDW